MLADAMLSAILNVVVLAGIPFLVYFLWHRLRHKRGLAEVARRAGLQVGDPRYIGYCALFAAVSVALLLIWSPPLEFVQARGRRSGSSSAWGSPARRSRWRSCTGS